MNGKRPTQKWKTNQSTKINLIGCDTIVNSPISFWYDSLDQGFPPFTKWSYTFIIKLQHIIAHYIHSIPRQLIIEIMSANQSYWIQKISCLPGVIHPKKASVLMIRASRYELQKVVQTLVHLWIYRIWRMAAMPVSIFRFCCYSFITMCRFWSGVLIGSICWCDCS